MEKRTFVQVVDDAFLDKICEGHKICETLTYEEWRQKRDEVCKVMSQWGKEHYINGDFDFDTDWYKKKKLSGIIMNTSLLNRDVLSSIQKDLKDHAQDYIVSLVGDYPKCLVRFLIYIFPDKIFLSYGSNFEEMKKIVHKSNKDYKYLVERLDSLAKEKI
ncbi:MAG: hypothetical protein WCV67_07070 [Victivallaceae bacterium]|jgi:hypothetical protein